VDFARLREDRRQRLLAAMDADGLDAVILGRSANVHYASGARQLWRAGTAPFAPIAVVVGETARVHLMSVWDEGVPPEIGHDDLYGLYWNPANIVRALQAIPGLASARRLGTDSMSPLFAQLLPVVTPNAELADASATLTRVRATKTADELTCIATATAIAERALTALEDALVPATTERELLGVFDEVIARVGVPTPASESVALATAKKGPVSFRQLVTDRPIGAGDLVVLSPSVLYAGYEGGLARTRLAGHGSDTNANQDAANLATRCRAAQNALVAACRPGATGGDLYRAWASTGEPEPPVALAHGLGLGAEPPVIGFGRGAGAVLEAGTVLSVQAWTAAEGTGGYLQRDAVHVGPEGPSVLSRARSFGS
jgi:Xaa-Pro dipeptidase